MADNLFKDRELARTLVESRILLGYRDVKEEQKTLIDLGALFAIVGEPGIEPAFMKLAATRRKWSASVDDAMLSECSAQ